MTKIQPEPVDGFLRLPQVLKIIPVSRSTWYRGIKSGIYPEPVKLGRRAIGWKNSSVTLCITELEGLDPLPKPDRVGAIPLIEMANELKEL